MGTFTLDGNAQAIRSVSTGIKNAFNNYMRADSAKQEAYLDAMGKTKAAEEARSLRMTNDHRESVDRMIADDPDMPQFKKNQLIALKLLGGQHMDNFSRSGEIEQRISHREAVLKDPSLATATAQAHAATSGKAPFDNIGNTGHSMNNVTGEQHMAHPGMAKLFNATHGAKSAQRGAVAAKQYKTDIDATNAKAYNAIVAQVEKDMPRDKDENIRAEVDRRWARRSFPSVNIEPAVTERSKVQTNIVSGRPLTIDDLPAGSKIIGTSGGKPVYLAPNGKKYIDQ